MNRRLTTRLGLAVATTAVVLSLSAGSALAGEVTRERQQERVLAGSLDLQVLGPE